ncbi:hypothetical protein Ccrd_025509 [Cynara cardunculus var. scolymus]|uniref:Uncharacterized protein n=1 Tax=Cynara cardunculus var. scolymus TaxID=59895 RepID=A0A103WW25_CYNCS|nr:hypothetical protein Ccrd_025509 [Cynara cardunculus var. scolymus]
MLESVQPLVVKRVTGNLDMRFKAFDMVAHDNQTQVSTISIESLWPRSMSTDSSLYKDYESSEMKLLTDLYDVSI